jgi:carbon catabolite-derepressing protein kinase
MSWCVGSGVHVVSELFDQVYMDIQLYQVDEHDNYLVDFRNVGYREIVRKSPRPGSVTPSESGTESERGSFTMPPPRAEELRARMQATNNAITTSDGVRVIRSNTPQVIPRSTAGVNSPFLFLECACQLIIELAIGGSQ